VNSIKGSTSTRGRDGGVKWNANNYPNRLYSVHGNRSKIACLEQSNAPRSVVDVQLSRATILCQHRQWGQNSK
jgi:hypothetical protein